MSKIALTINERQQNYTSLRAAFRSENGAIDLASIMVGIIVIGLIGGVIAATVFAVIPWAQDNAAKQQLDSIHTAENASYGLSADPTVTPDQTKRNMFTDSPGLETSKLLAQSVAYCVVPSTDGKDYTAYAKSASGKIWTAMNSAKKATVLTGTPTGACSTLGTGAGGTATVSANGGVVTTYSTAGWSVTQGLAITADQTLYGTDAGSAMTIKKLTADGVMTSFAGSTNGFANGQGAAAKFSNPRGITMDSAGNIIVADLSNHRIRKVTPTGLVSTIVGTGVAGGTDGSVSTATINLPFDVAYDTAGNLYISETGGNKVRKVSPAGVVSTIATLTGAGTEMDVDSSGNVYVIVADNKITKITAAGVSSTFASGSTYNGLAIDQPTGNVYVIVGGSTVEKILPDGTKTVLAGTAGQYGNVNGTGADARFSNPTAITVNSTGGIILSSEGYGDETLRLIK